MNHDEIEQRIIEEGRPFHIKLSTGNVNNTTEVVFYLRSDSEASPAETGTDYDWDYSGADDVIPFENYELYITGITCDVGAAKTLGAIKVDEKVLFSGLSDGIGAGEDFYADGDWKTKGTATDGNNPTLKEVFGVRYIKCRHSFAVKASASTADTSGIDLIVKGFALKREGLA